MRKVRYVQLAALASLPLATLGLGTDAASGAGAIGGGVIHVWQVPDETSVTSPVVITGVFGDYGTTTSQDKNGKADENGSYEKFVLQQGTFVINAIPLSKVLNKVRPTFDKRDCGAVFSGSGPVTVSDGTGSYSGIKGTLRVTATDAFILAKGANGKCSQSAAPVASYSTIVGSGHVNF
jgi:hypothetical protein